MNVEELYAKARDVIRHSDPTGITIENAAPFIENVMIYLRQMGGWLPPAYGSMGYADAEVIDWIRRLKFQSEGVLKNFPMGLEALSRELDHFCHFLADHYPVAAERSSDADY